MSIINAYDESEAIITPDKIYKKIDKLTDICIVTFSHHVIERILNNYKNEIITSVSTANGKVPIYYLKDLNVLTYQSIMSSTVSSIFLEEVAYITSVTKFIFFGSCGVLDEKYKNKYIIPTKSYRDEGFSYHYMKPTDYIDIKNANTIIDLFNELNIDYVAGSNWTTDAIYRETINKWNKRKEEGCISVEMESAGLQAISNYLNIDLYIFFFAGDILSESWDSGNLIGENHKNRQLDSFEIALALAKKISC